MEREQLISLITRYMDHSISDRDLVLLKNVLRQMADEDLMDIWDSFEDSPVHSEENRLDADNLFQKIMSDRRIEESILSQDINKTDSAGMIRRVLTILTAACALILLKIVIGYFYNPSLSGERTSSVDISAQILPGSNKARIVLADGSEIDLQQLRNDTTIRLKGYAVHKRADGAITYTLDHEGNVGSDIYNTIITPRGGEYSLTMADGTKVAVNASSTLRYPVTFQGDVREVELVGEAYFEVSKQMKEGKRIPFIVKTDQQMLEVLGTSFNINSYDKAIRTTLVEGSVKLSFENGQNHVLSPNQQAVFEKETKNTTIKVVDPFYVMAWKNGSFAFEDASIHEVMESVARWYDVEVSFKEDLRDKRFSGTISRFENIGKLLKTIELTGSVHFKVDERRIMVMK